MMGLVHGESVGKNRIDYYEESLCGDEDDYWSQCIQIDTSHIKSIELKKPLIGRLILNNKGVLGMYTKTGPVVVTMPKVIYLEAEKNNCYGGCENSKSTVATESK